VRRTLLEVGPAPTASGCKISRDLPQGIRPGKAALHKVACGFAKHRLVDDNGIRLRFGFLRQLRPSLVWNRNAPGDGLAIHFDGELARGMTLRRADMASLSIVTEPNSELVNSKAVYLRVQHTPCARYLRIR
jgi:hypothetical protein